MVRLVVGVVIAMSLSGCALGRVYANAYFPPSYSAPETSPSPQDIARQRQAQVDQEKARAAWQAARRLPARALLECRSLHPIRFEGVNAIIPLAGAFFGLAAAYALPDALAGWFPEPLGLGLLLAGGTAAAFGAALVSLGGAELDGKPGKGRQGTAAEPLGLRRLPAEGGRSPYGPENSSTDV